MFKSSLKMMLFPEGVFRTEYTKIQRILKQKNLEAFRLRDVYSTSKICLILIKRFGHEIRQIGV